VGREAKERGERSDRPAMHPVECRSPLIQQPGGDIGATALVV
jgi:hypothetical protein